NAHPDSGGHCADVAPEDLAHADLGRPGRHVPETDHPQGDHVGRVVDGATSNLEDPVLRCVQRDAPLLLADDEPVAEMDLAETAAEWPREDTCLKRRGARLTVELGAPRRLIGIDPQAKAAIDLV